MKRFLLIVLITGALIYSFKPTTEQDFLSKRFKNGYKVKAVKIENSLVAYVDFIESYETCGKDPLVYLTENGSVKSVYKVHISDFCVFNDKFLVSGNLIISEWIGTAGGSGGYRGLILWKIVDGELQPVGGFPNDSDVFKTETFISATNENSQQQFSYPLGSMNGYSAYQLKNPLELWYANMIWKVDEESHAAPHFWNLYSYSLNNNVFSRNQSWNNGETYITKEKIEGWSDEAGKVLNKDFEKLY